jgi:hypothetical protein
VSDISSFAGNITGTYKRVLSDLEVDCELRLMNEAWTMRDTDHLDYAGTNALIETEHYNCAYYRVASSDDSFPWNGLELEFVSSGGSIESTTMHWSRGLLGCEWVGVVSVCGTRTRVRRLSEMNIAGCGVVCLCMQDQAE